MLTFGQFILPPRIPGLSFSVWQSHDGDEDLFVYSGLCCFCIYELLWDKFVPDMFKEVTVVSAR